MKAVVAAFNQEKALVGAFSVITNLRMELFEALKQDDFLPYASDPHAYWTGFYSSRPTSKRLVRETETMLRTLHQLGLLARAEAAPLQLLEETVGVVQHHDAVTGNTPL